MRPTRKKLTNDPVLIRILKLLREENKTEKDMVRYLKIGNGAFTHWKYEEQKSFMKYIIPMAEFLDVTPNYLLYGEDEEVTTGTLSSQEIKLIRNYRRLNREQKECIMNVSRWFINTTDKMTDEKQQENLLS